MDTCNIIVAEVECFDAETYPFEIEAIRCENCTAREEIGAPEEYDGDGVVLVTPTAPGQFIVEVDVAHVGSDRKETARLFSNAETLRLGVASKHPC